MGELPAQERINERNMYITTGLMQRRDVHMGYVKLITTALSYNTEFRYASARSFLEELKKIAPPVLMISDKTLSFGRLNSTAGPVQRKFTVFNAGGTGDFTGIVRSNAPWLKVEMPDFKTARRDIIVSVDPSKISERDTVVRGELEVTASRIAISKVR